MAVIQHQRVVPMKTLLSTMMFALLVLTGTLLVGPSDSAPDGSDLASWTFLVYICADNNLEADGIADMNEMESVGSTPDVNIIVQFDRWETTDDADDTTNGDWTDCKRFRVEKDGDPSTINSPPIVEMGEVNMGDPAVFNDFVVWSVENYPARNYALVYWDHGGGFRGVCWDETVPGSDTYDSLNLTEIGDTLEGLYLARGSERVELVGFDACLMAEVEVLYEIQDYAVVCDASGFNEPNAGWPYAEILGPLVDKPTMDEFELGGIIADEYVKSYTDGNAEPSDPYNQKIIMTAFDLTKMDELVMTLDRFSEELASPGPLDTIKYLRQIYVARESCNSYDGVNFFIYDLTGYPLYDVYDFTLELEKQILLAYRNDRILGLCKDVRTAIDSVIIDGYAASLYEGNAWGLSMYFPNKEEKLLSARMLPTAYDQNYDEISYVRDHLWDDFLHAFYGIDPIIDSFPVVSITDPEFNHTYVNDEKSGQIRGEAYDREGIRKVEIRIDGGNWMEISGMSGQGTIGWIYYLDVASLDPGTHAIEVRAHDTLGETSPGHITAPQMLQIAKEEPPSGAGDGGLLTDWMISGAVLAFVAGAFVLGVALLRRKLD
jgi:hypothetical protein